MSKEIESLKAFGDRIVIGKQGFALLPYNLSVIADINAHYSTEEQPNGHDYAIKKAFESFDVKIAAELLYFFLKDKAKFDEDINKWREFILENVSQAEVVYSALTSLITQGKADFNFEDKKKAPRRSMAWGWMLIILATIGMIHTLTWLHAYLSPFLNSLI